MSLGHSGIGQETDRKDTTYRKELDITQPDRTQSDRITDRTQQKEGVGKKN